MTSMRCGRHRARHAHRLGRQPEQPDRQFPALSAAEGLPAEGAADVVVVLDEAYNEYLPPADRVDTVAGSLNPRTS